MIYSTFTLIHFHYSTNITGSTIYCARSINHTWVNHQISYLLQCYSCTMDEFSLCFVYALFKKGSDDILGTADTWDNARSKINPLLKCSRKKVNTRIRTKIYFLFTSQTNFDHTHKIFYWCCSFNECSRTQMTSTMFKLNYFKWPAVIEVLTNIAIRAAMN